MFEVSRTLTGVLLAAARTVGTGLQSPWLQKFHAAVCPDSTNLLSFC